LIDDDVFPDPDDEQIANRKWKNYFSPFLYRARNAIERMFCRLKDFRRVATRYDRNAANFLAAVCIAATVSYWL
jgi:transposase